MTQYRVLQGIDYPPNKRAEAGDVVNDLPASSVKWLLEVGAIADASANLVPCTTGWITAGL